MLLVFPGPVSTFPSDRVFGVRVEPACTWMPVEWGGFFFFFLTFYFEQFYACRKVAQIAQSFSAPSVWCRPVLTPSITLYNLAWFLLPGNEVLRVSVFISVGFCYRPCSCLATCPTSAPSLCCHPAQDPTWHLGTHPSFVSTL